MQWTVLSTLVILLVSPAVARISPYDPEDNKRPDNVTGLDFRYYDRIGSYFNGSFTIHFYPEYNPPERYVHEDATYPCDEFENRTFTISMQAILGIQQVSPTKDPSPNPFFLDIWAFAKGYNLSFGTYSGNNFSEYEAVHIEAEDDCCGNGPVWYYDITDMPPGPVNGPPSYYFNGDMNTDFLRDQKFKFNASGVCDGSGWSDEEALLYSGSFLAPSEDGEDGPDEFDWTDLPLPIPTISGRFENRTAEIDLSGLFRANSGSTPGGPVMVGKVEMYFRGTIDEERSDKLLVGRDAPEWKATLGFDADKGSVGGDGESGASVLPWTLSSVFLAGIVSIGLLI